MLRAYNQWAFRITPTVAFVMASSEENSPCLCIMLCTVKHDNMISS